MPLNWIWGFYGVLGLWCLTPLSTIFQLFRGGYWANDTFSDEQFNMTKHIYIVDKQSKSIYSIQFQKGWVNTIIERVTMQTWKVQ